MKRMLFFAVSVLAAALLAAPAASARTTFCIPESLRLLGTDGNDLCLGVPTPSITPPFTAFAEQNGSQDTWCLYTGPKYSGSMLRVPAFSSATVFATFASGRPC
ncbi:MULTISPECIES: hypothetical protein [unclassified Amycolatopsis]|uniref:hypothetical protein n=1 Tax=unclassified Amycolatopsis TaxID=2618356 RepID=UPI002876BDFB|nr:MULTISPECIES: hypothetical protein [unclassified Amycolatopsis]MDS0139786.1 hypothetical protein [Amycolatopsis sp. 505]MDS0145209.1 hypothetical protein [Amycolatopsis sp. CM201R]